MTEESTRIRGELEALLADVQELMQRAGHLTDAEVTELKQRAQEKIASARQSVGRGVDAASDYVERRPWNAVAIAAGLGLLLGLVIGRR
ncbi:MAG: DUF883 family protein [Pseudomonadales bacterium]|nr:DUF883 family protein [Pseudomonadales bacterium]